MILALPWVLLTLAAMPALAAIYLLRNRSRRQPVSSLMLWMDLTRPREGGRRLKRMQVPLLLLLELLALGFLGLASAGPYVRAAGASRPLVIVLDDSFSMRAGGEDSSRARAVRAVEETLRAEPDASVQFILAGSAPQMLGDRAADLRRAGELLARWRCLAPAASLDAAVSLAATVGGRTARILVCTDRPPPREISEGRVLWRAFGRQSPNVAIVNAARSVHEGRDRCLVELANYSDDRARAVLTLSADAVPAALATRAVDLPAGEKATLFFEVPADTKIVYARLGNDALGLDNKVTLLPDAGRPVRVALRLENPALREAVQRALEASGRARLTAAGAELLVTDGAPPPDRAPETWSLRFIVDKEAE
ncbi:MAG: BatA and WFA domain-containing protein, partial [Phycisphaerae bacterium]